MIAFDFEVKTAEEALRLVRALGVHRYIAGRLHTVHAFAVVGVGDDAGGVLTDALRWATHLLEHNEDALDLSSRDEHLWRRCSDAELLAVLDAYWNPGTRSRDARDALRSLLDRHGLWPQETAAFDESAEDRVHPLTLDAGWQLLDLQELDPERHKGAIAAFGSDLAFESARFEEETAIPPQANLYELPALGPIELIHGVDDQGAFAEPFVIWVDGNETYVDYVLRGVRRAAQL